MCPLGASFLPRPPALRTGVCNTPTVQQTLACSFSRRLGKATSLQEDQSREKSRGWLLSIK